MNYTLRKYLDGGRYWDRTSDHIEHAPQLVEIPTWFEAYTISQTYQDLDPKNLRFPESRFESETLRVFEG